MMLATIQLLADAAAASNTFDASGVAQLVIGLVGGGAVAGGSYALGRRTTVTNDPLHCKEIKDLVPREEHDKDIDELRQMLRESEEKTRHLYRASEEKIHDLLRASEEKNNNLIRASEIKAHERMDAIAQALNQLIGHVKGIRDSLLNNRKS